MRLLVVDDDAELCDLLVRALERDGHSVAAASTAAEAREAFRNEHIDVAVLDLALPDGSGIALCRELRAAQSEVPILMLTAHSEVDKRVRSLDAGADDFLGKPFAVAELRARVRALGRRRGVRASLACFKSADVRLEFSARRATRGGRNVDLTAREWAILEALAARPGRVVGRGDLLEECWGEATTAHAASLEVLIGRIRRKLGEPVVRTLRGAGYSLGDA
jgi:DNA-binding response OmpR family regulator